MTTHPRASLVSVTPMIPTGENASFSIGVSNLDALYEEYRGIPARVGPLEMKSWGRREFHMIVPSGVCFQFYNC